MATEKLSFQDPKYFYGSYFFKLRSFFDSEPFFDNLDSTSPNSLPKPDTKVQQPSARRQVLDRILDKISSLDLPGKSHFEQYMRHKYRRNCRPNTLRVAATSLTQFLSFYRSTGKYHLEQMSREDIEAFVEYEQDRGLKPNSVRTHMCGVYAFVYFLIEKKVVGYELLERRIKLKLPDRLPRAIDADDLKKLLSVIDHVRDRALILLLLRTGMRIGELLDTKVDDVDLREQKILIYQANKTGVGRVVYYSDDAQVALLAWLKIRDPFKENLFYSQHRQSLCYEGARALFTKYLQKAGLLNNGYTLHCLRHTFATDLLNARMRLEYLQVLMGHTNLEVTRRYARLSDKTREEEYFKDMARIEKGEFNADDERDY